MTASGGARGRLLRFGWEHRVRDDPTVFGLTQEVLLVMATFSDPDGTLHVGEARIGLCVGKSERTVRRAIGPAIASGYLERLTLGHNVPGQDPVPSSYRLTWPDPPANSEGLPDAGEGLRVVDDELGDEVG